jgi:hypothetical protein
MGYHGYAPAKLPTELTAFQKSLKKVESLESCVSSLLEVVPLLPALCLRLELLPVAVSSAGHHGRRDRAVLSREDHLLGDSRDAQRRPR